MGPNASEEDDVNRRQLLELWDEREEVIRALRHFLGDDLVTSVRRGRARVASATYALVGDEFIDRNECDEPGVALFDGARARLLERVDALLNG